MIYAQNEIHSVALKFTEAISQKEKALLDELHLYYGDETNEYLKKKDDLESFLEQLKSTCSLTEMVVKGKDIEMLLLKKQLCEKFDEFQEVVLDPVPRNIQKKVIFVPGNVDLGKLIEPELNRSSPAREIILPSVAAATTTIIKHSSPVESENFIQVQFQQYSSARSRLMHIVYSTPLLYSSWTKDYRLTSFFSKIRLKTCLTLIKNLSG